MRIAFALWIACLAPSAATAQCAPAPDSPYFFRNLSEERAEAKIAADPAVFERLLSDSFVSRAADGKPLGKHEFISAEIAARPATAGRRFYSISDYTLVEYTVATYLLTEGVTGGGHAHVVESQLREVYEVRDGKWLLASVESTPEPAPAVQSN